MIELKSINAGYKSKTVLHNVSVSFSKASLTCIIGENGSGKSTLLKTIAGILPAKSGDIIIDGQNASNLSRKDVAKKISYLSQFNRTSDMTVAQTVLHGRFAHLNYPRVYSAEDKKIASDCMEQLGISELANIPLSELSGGMQQNTYIAMALAGRSDYILLDEPTSYLDVSNKFRLMHTLKALCSQGKGIVAVMHDLTLALQFADNIVVVHSNGSLTKLSTEQLFTSDIIPNTFGVKIGRHTIENEHIYYLYQTKNKHL